MSTPHIAWAFAQRGLTAAQRVVLIALAERANGELTCFPSEARLADDCEFSRRTVIAAVQYLRDERKLIEVVTDVVERAAILVKAGASAKARANVYRILRPHEGEKSAPSQKSNGAKSARSEASDAHDGEKSAHNHGVREKSAHLTRSNGAKSAHQTAAEGEKSSEEVCKSCTRDGAAFAHEPLNESLNEKKKGEGFQNSEHQGGTPTPEPIPKAPTLGTTQDCSQALIQPSRQDEPLSIADTLVLLSAHRPPPTPEPEAEPEPEPAANPKAVRRAVASTVYSLRKYAAAEGVAQMRTREQQRTEVLLGPEPPPPAAHRGPVDPVMTQAEQLAELQRMIAEEAPRPEQPAPKLRLVPDAAPPEELPPIPRGLEAIVRAARRALLARA